MEESVASRAAGSRSEVSSRSRGERLALFVTGGMKGDWPAAWLLIAPVLILFGIAVIFPLIVPVVCLLSTTPALATPPGTASSATCSV